MITNPAAPAACAPNASRRRWLSRRRLLRGAGIALSLPFLESMLPAQGRAAALSAPVGPGAKPRRFFGICSNLGVRPDLFFPKGTGRDYQSSVYLDVLKEHRKDFTVFSGVSHPGVDGGHPADACFLTAAPGPGGNSFRNTISLDQHIAQQIGVLTRFPSLTLSVNTRRASLSYTAAGVAIPPADKAADVFRQLFFQGTPEQIEAQIRKLDTGRSILDAVADRTRDLERRVGVRDRDRLDQYFTSVRDLEQRLLASREWERKPKPVVSAVAPSDPSKPSEYLGKIKVMYDLARLAFETDSTRSISLMLDGVSTPVMDLPDATLTDGYHNLSHHSRSEEKLAQLKVIDVWHMKLLAKLLADLKGVREGEESLLDRTMVLYGSNFGDANLHVTTNMPVILAGGGFRHGQHLAFDTGHNYPLPNLFVSILQRMGINEDRFASSSGTMRGLELS
jgi:hypothetical protein